MYTPKENIWDIELNNTFEEVTDYIKRKTDKISKIKQDLTNINELFKNFISITKKYCDQIAFLALQLKPDANTNEGNLIQAIQGILLFNSVSLETLAKEMEKSLGFLKNQENVDSCLNALDDYSKLYQTNYSDLIKSYCTYINEIEQYEKYLMNEEMGLNNNNFNNDHKLKEKITPQKITNNIDKVLQAKKNYLEQRVSMNNIIDQIVKNGLKLETMLNEGFSNILKIFLSKLNECLEGQKKKYEGQSLILEHLSDKIKSEKIEKYNDGIQEYHLHCLSVYINIKNLMRNKNSNAKESVKNQKSKDFDIYKDITLENIDHIIKEMKRNGLEIRKKDLEDLENEKVKDFIEKKSKLVSSKTDENFTEEDKNKLIKYLKEDEEYRSLFLQILNNDRAKGGQIFNKNIFLYIGEIFSQLNDLVLEKNDYKFFKYISIIAMTYFINEGKKKIYLFECIKDNDKLKNMEFWKNYSSFVVDCDIKNDITKQELKTEQSIKTKYKFAGFSNALTIVNNMVNFGFDRDIINEYINFAKQKYSLTKEQIDQIEDLIIVWTSNLDSSENHEDKETTKNETDSKIGKEDEYEDMK